MKDNIYDFASVHIELEIVTAITSMELYICSKLYTAITSIELYSCSKLHTVSGMLMKCNLAVLVALF